MSGVSVGTCIHGIVDKVRADASADHRVRHIGRREDAAAPDDCCSRRDSHCCSQSYRKRRCPRGSRNLARSHNLHGRLSAVRLVKVFTSESVNRTAAAFAPPFQREAEIRRPEGNMSAPRVGVSEDLS